MTVDDQMILGAIPADSPRRPHHAANGLPCSRLTTHDPMAYPTLTSAVARHGQRFTRRPGPAIRRTTSSDGTNVEPRAPHADGSDDAELHTRKVKAPAQR